MSKKVKTSAAPKSAKSLLLSIIPVAAALVLIFVIAGVVTLVTRANDKKPTIKDGNDIYFTYGDLKVTKNDLYANMKIEYGAAELIRLVDEKLYAKEIAKIDADEELTKALEKYILNSLFGVENLEDYEGTDEELQEEWEVVIDSLIMNGLVKESELEEEDKNVSVLEDPNKDENSTVWPIIKDNYKLQFARNEWAKKAYIEKYKAEKEAKEEELFTEKQIKDAYSKYYESTSYGLFIPFTSEAAAYAMMEKYGINTQTGSINNEGWISSEYDYNSNADKTAYKLSDEKVVKTFIAMYNEVLHFYNGTAEADKDDVIIADSNIDESVNYSRVFYTAVREVKKAVEAVTISGKVVLPTEIELNDGTKISIKWEMNENTLLNLENENALTLKTTEVASSSSKVSVKATVTMNVSSEETYSTVETLNVSVQKLSEDKEDKTIEAPKVELYKKYVLTQDFMDSFEDDEKQANEYSKFKWTGSELIALDTKLNTYLKAGGTLLPMVGHDEYAELYQSYTVSPVKGTNYYYLMIKFFEVPCAELENNEEVKKDLIEKLLEELATDNNIEQMIYKNRNDAGLQIYDKYLEAIYEYNYNNFFSSAKVEYDNFKISKKKNTKDVASFKVDGKKMTIKADELYASLEEKYGVSTIISAVNQYQIVGNASYNKYYNPYTGEVANKKALEELLEGEVSVFRQNFEQDYFTIPYLSMYGLIPNFPATYGWNDFRNDYFGVKTDKLLLTSANFGGYIYNDALKAFKEDAFVEKDAEGNITVTRDSLIIEEMKKAVEEYYSLNVINLIVSLDSNFDGTYDKNDPENKNDKWTAEQDKGAQDLAKLMFEKAPETLKANLSDQLTAVVEEYNAAALNDSTWGYYKSLGLVVKFEPFKEAYTNSSNLVPEFLDQLKVLADQIKAYELVGETLDSPLVSAEPFQTSYGYHHIAVLASSKATELPTDEQIAAYKAYLEYTEVKDSTYKFMKDEIEAAKKAYADALKAAGLEVKEDENGKITTTLDEATTKLLQATYDTAASTVDGNDTITNKTLDFLTSGIESKKFVFTNNNDDRINQLKAVIEITKANLEKDE